MESIGAFGSAVSGLHAQVRRFHVAANNIVNANSDGYSARRADFVSVQPRGVETEISRTDRPVDVAREFVNLIEAELGYRANAEVVRTTEQLQGALLDIVA